MTTKSKSILVAPLFALWLIIIIFIFLILLFFELKDWIKFWLWDQFTKPFVSEQWDNFRFKLGIVSYDDIREGTYEELIDPNSKFYNPKQAKKDESDYLKYSLEIKRNIAIKEMADEWIKAKKPAPLKVQT